MIRQATPSPELSGPADPATVLAPVAPVPLAAATSAALYRSAPVVVLAADGDAGGQAGAASAAVALGAPMLLTPSADANPADATAMTDELTRLAPQAVLAVGAGAPRTGPRTGRAARGSCPPPPTRSPGWSRSTPGDARAVDPPRSPTRSVGWTGRAPSC